jgi:DNA-binding CsgD family transcriptional regulator
MTVFPAVGILEKIEAAQDIPTLERIVFDIRDFYGFAHTVFHVTHTALSNTNNPLLLLTYPEEWVSIYKNRDYFTIDPVVNAGLTGFLPIEWSTLNWQSPNCAGFLKKARSYDVGQNGITLTIRGPLGERSLFTMTSNLSGDQWSRLCQESISDFQVLGHFFHDRAMNLMGFRKTQNIPRLSKREKECLQLVANGVLPKNIAPFLSLSESAVRLYLTSCRRKLGSISTAHAIAHAVSLELIR